MSSLSSGQTMYINLPVPRCKLELIRSRLGRKVRVFDAGTLQIQGCVKVLSRYSAHATVTLASFALLLAPA